MIKHSKILLIIAITLIIVTVVSATYAYFASGSINTTNNTNLNATVGNVTNINLVTVGDTITLNASSKDMLAANISNEAVSTDTGTLQVKLTAGSPDIPIVCEYDLYYVWEKTSDEYIRSNSNKYEFTYMIDRNEYYIYRYKTNYVNTTNTPQLIGTEQIESKGTEVTHTYTITSNFYNLNIDQTLNANKNFKIKYYIDTNESRCTKAITNGTVYRNTRTTTQLGNSIYNRGDFETTLFDRLNTEYSIYCPIGGFYTTCALNTWRYYTMEACEDDISGSSINYYCTSTTYTKNFYLKHDIENGVISNSEVCIYHSGKEFCLQPNYWDTDKETTMTKLKEDMESNLEVTADECNYYPDPDDFVYCYFGNDYCAASTDYVLCDTDYDIGCAVYNDGSSHCNLDD